MHCGGGKVMWGKQMGGEWSRSIIISYGYEVNRSKRKGGREFYSVKRMGEECKIQTGKEE